MAVLNLSDNEKIDLSERYDDNKRTFERVLSRDLRAFFAGVTSDTFANFSATGNPPDTDDYTQELMAILILNYRKTGAFFSSHIQRLLKEVVPESEEQEEVLNQVREERTKIEARILLLLIPFYRNQARQQAGFILRTTQQIIRDEQLKVLTEEALTQQVFSPNEIARKISRGVSERNAKRLPNIASDQVGDIAQQSKQIEAEEIAKSSRAARIGLEPQKTWIDLGDGKVRDAHRKAGGQKRGLNELYLVGGELLMHPKDSKHGASLGNTINCRCDSVTTI